MEGKIKEIGSTVKQKKFEGFESVRVQKYWKSPISEFGWFSIPLMENKLRVGIISRFHPFEMNLSVKNNTTWFITLIFKN